MTHRSRRTPASLAVTFALVLLPLMVPGGTFAQTPAASPEAVPPLPQGPLGDQIGWMVGLLNGPPEDVTAENVEPHLAPEFLADVSAVEVAATAGQFASSFAPFTIEENSIVTTMDLPATNGRLVLVGAGGVRVELAITIDRDSGLISGLRLALAVPVASPDASPQASPAT